MEAGAEVKVLSCKYDGSVRRSWRARLSSLEGSLVVLDGFFEDEILHPILGTIARGTLSTEYFWTDRWFSIFRFREPSGRLRNFYCNINTPARLEAGLLTFVDLDIDMLVKPDFSYIILDEDEFEENSELYKYPIEYRRRTRQSLDELISMIETRQFPFSNA
jgi:protein associated with RNAse G/E